MQVGYQWGKVENEHITIGNKLITIGDDIRAIERNADVL